jgi:hypothetical protein
MSLPIQNFRMSEVAEAGMDMGGFAASTERTFTPAVRVIGECFAFTSDALAAEAQGCGLAWHEWLLRRSVMGLWEERSRNKVYVCYTLHTGMVRVYFCSHQKRYPEKFHKIISATNAYIESGRDGFPMGYARSLAYWEAPCTAVALWPRGLGGETDGARVVDTGNAMSYFSYPESEHDAGISVDKAGPEYVRVPQQELTEFDSGGTSYHCMNRWAAGEMDLRLEF